MLNSSRRNKHLVQKNKSIDSTMSQKLPKQLSQQPQQRKINKISHLNKNSSVKTLKITEIKPEPDYDQSIYGGPSNVTGVTEKRQYNQDRFVKNRQFLVAMQRMKLNHLKALSTLPDNQVETSGNIPIKTGDNCTCPSPTK